MGTISDPKVINNFYYKKTRQLQLRLHSWDNFGTNPIKFRDWVITKLTELNGQNSKLLDAGFGTASFIENVTKKFPKVDIVGLDISPAMVKQARARFRKQKNFKFLCGDVQAIPFHNKTFTTVVAMHMLYHVPNINKAMQEIKRVLNKGGSCFVTTSDYKLETSLNRIHYLGLKSLNFPATMQNKKKYLRFTPDTAQTFMKKYFKQVKIYRYRNDLVFKTVKSCMDYYQSAMMYRNSHGPHDPTVGDKKWKLLYSFVENQVAMHIARFGNFRIPGVVVAYKGTQQ